MNGKDRKIFYIAISFGMWKNRTFIGKKSHRRAISPSNTGIFLMGIAITIRF